MKEVMKLGFFMYHELRREPDGTTLILHINPNQTEFANELGIAEKANTTWKDTVQEYIKNNLPAIKVNTVKIMFGTFMVTSMAVGANNAAAASLEETNVKTVDKKEDNYTVQAGDTLYSIAKRFNLTVEQLKEMNHLSSDIIHVGQVLTIAALAPAPVMPAAANSVYTVAAGDTLWKIAGQFGTSVAKIKEANQLETDFLKIGQQLVIPADSAAAAPSPAVPAESGYKVAAGDTLFLIAKKFNVSVDQLKQANNLTSDLLHIGQMLTIPSGQVDPSPVPVQGGTASYTVKAGDTLSLIAKNYNVSIDQLKQANHLSSDLIGIGQVLTIPNAQAGTGPAPVQEEVTTTSYTVKAGDTLSLIAKQYNVTVDAIKMANNLSTDLIRVGQVLIIPGTPVPAAEKVGEMDGEAVAQLKELGYLAAPVSTTDGNTYADSLKAFQRDYGIPVSGVADETTKTELAHALVKKTLVQDSLKYQGIPYLWGGTTTKGFDCSGFVYFMFNSHDVNMPRSTSQGLFAQGKAIAKGNLQPGDLVFFAVNTPGTISHVGFYIGNNQFISATTSKGIAVAALDSTYWGKYYTGAKRIY